MTPALFDLPLRLGDAATLADLLFNQPPGAHAKPLTDDLRARLATRAAGLNFDCMKPLLPSLERDPVHPSAFYVCVDGVDDQPLLLRVAPSKTPSSGLFPKAILIGRTFVGSQEAVLSAVPFGPGDRDPILTFSGQVNKAFQPRAFGSRPVTLVTGEPDADEIQMAFEGFRKLVRTTGQNTAAFGLPEGGDGAALYFATVRGAIRCGWREGFALHSSATVAPIPGVARRPFETGLNVKREIVLRRGMTKEEIVDLF